jgi:hypothetical protein
MAMKTTGPRRPGRRWARTRAKEGRWVLGAKWGVYERCKRAPRIVASDRKMSRWPTPALSRVQGSATASAVDARAALTAALERALVGRQELVRRLEKAAETAEAPVLREALARSATHVQTLLADLVLLEPPAFPTSSRPALERRTRTQPPGRSMV